MPPRTVLLIDDHPIVRLGFEALLHDEPGMRLVQAASSLDEGLEAIARLQPDLVISDIGLGSDLPSLEAVRSVIQAQQPRPTLVVSMLDEAVYGAQVLALGASGYVMKNTDFPRIVAAARAVLEGQVWASPVLAAQLLQRHVRRASPAKRPDGAPATPFTLRELEVLNLLREGKTTKEIAFALSLSPRTVDIHRANMKRKLGLRSGNELLAFALRRA